MDTVKTLFDLKSELKAAADEIRGDKKSIKDAQRAGGYAGTTQYHLIGKKKAYRHRHIAYSLMKGRTYEQIEPKCAQGNEPDMALIRRICDEYTQTVRACA